MNTNRIAWVPNLSIFNSTAGTFSDRLNKVGGHWTKIDTNNLSDESISDICQKLNNETRGSVGQYVVL